METSCAFNAFIRAFSASFYGTSPGETATMWRGCGRGFECALLCAAMPSASAPPEEKPQVLTFPPPQSAIIQMHSDALPDP